MRKAYIHLSILLMLAGCENQVLIDASEAIITLNTEEILFGEIPVETTVSKGLTIVNAGKARLEVTAISLGGDDPQFFGTSTNKVTVSTSSEEQLRITFSPTAEADYAAVLEIKSNASNAEKKTVLLSGSGIPSSTCGPCDTPPQAACITEYNRIEYANQGTCVGGECRYEASVEDCPQGCDPNTRQCVGALPDAGVVYPDATVVDDAAVVNDATVVPDALVGTDNAPGPDANTPPDTGGFDTAPVCGVVTGANDLHNYVRPGEYPFVVPTGVTSVQVQMWGGGGAGGNQIGATGGGGGFAAATIPVTAGESLTLLVAEGGDFCPNRGGDGGGASYIIRGTTPLLVAAGGGGGGSDGCGGCKDGGRGGAGGGDTGQDGQHLTTGFSGYCEAARGGGGATQSGGGIGGVSVGSAVGRCNGNNGALDTGGSAKSSGSGASFSCSTDPGAYRYQAGGGQRNGGGGGGGAGYYGGGGAGFIWTYCSGGGGGGSSYSDVSNTAVTLTAGHWQDQGNAGASGSAGRGGAEAGSGYPGKIIINW